MDDMDNHISSRIDQLERRLEKIVDVINDLERVGDRVQLIIKQIQEQKLEERIRAMEIDMTNEKLVSKAIQWLGVSIGGTAILLLASYLFSGTGAP